MKRYLRKLKSIYIKIIHSKIDNRYVLNYKNRGIINFIDVGSVGDLPDPWFSNANKIKFVLNFEPSAAIKQSANSMTYNTAVWESEKTMPFYIYKGFRGTGSSLFKQNFKYVKDHFEELKERGPKKLANTWFERSKLVKATELKCKKIDTILQEEFSNTDFHFMKIDAQGAEYNILKGSEEFLKKCCGLHLELFTIPLYENIMLLEEVQEYLKGFGFYLAKKFPSHGTFNSQNDCLFIKKGASSEIISVLKEVYDLK
jgi:FkbM family methyltransferase